MQVTVTHPDTTDVRVIPAELRDRYVDRGWEVTETTTEPGDLKGAALDEALEAAGLPKTGSANDKRARLAEHQAGQTPDA